MSSPGLVSLRPGESSAMQEVVEFGSWRDLARQLIVFVIAYGIFSLTILLCNRHYTAQVRLSRKKDKEYWLQIRTAQFLGRQGDSADKNVARNQPPLFIALNFIQFCTSITAVGLWIGKSYTLEAPSTGQTILEIVFCAFYATHGILEVMRNEFRLSEVWRVRSFTDVLSGTSLLVSLVFQKKWMNLGYVRIYNAHWAFVRLVRSSQFMSDFQQACLLTFSKFVTLMTIFASTMFLVETLGDIDIFDESTLFTSNEKGKPISFFIMLYYSFVTISTVGYGDIAPESGLGRIFALVMIIVGILFFTAETSKMLELSNLLMNGKGAYKAPKRGGGHVIVTGGAVDNQNLRVFGPFLEELCHPSRGEERPQILLVSSNPLEEAVQKFLRQWWAVGLISFIEGTLVKLEDMTRTSLASAKMVFIIADVDAEDEEKEDERNLTVALAIKNMYPDFNLKVMLLKRESKKLAITAGIPPFVCYSNQNLEGLMLINSCRAPGISAIMMNMIKQEPIVYKHEYQDHNPDYVEGLKLEIHGILLKDFLWGMGYQQLASILYSKWEIILIGIMNKKGFHCSTSDAGKTDDKTIAYILPRDKRALDFVSRRSSEWDQEFEDNLKNILRLKHKMSRVSAKFVNKAEIDFHKIPSFRAESLVPKGGRTLRLKRKKRFSVISDSFESHAPLAYQTRGKVGRREGEEQISNHILILCQSDRQWQLVHVIARNIRQMQTTFRINVMLLCPYDAPEGIKSQDPWVIWKVGDPTSIKDLTQKGNVGGAARIILISPDNASSLKSQQLIQDQKIVFVTSILEQEFRRINRSVPVILEFNGKYLRSCSAMQEERRFLTLVFSIFISVSISIFLLHCNRRFNAQAATQAI